jgi:microcystin-dependent protein
MAQPFIGEVRMFAGNFAPLGWLFCDGSLLPISEYETLFNLIGTTYGGDGQSTFALPDLRGRVPIHQGPLAGGSTYVIGQSGGVESVTLTTQQIPNHGHALVASGGAGSASGPGGNVPALAVGNLYVGSPTSPTVNLSEMAIGSAGGSQPHDNLQPFLCVSFIISLFGIFPPRP